VIGHVYEILLGLNTILELRKSTHCGKRSHTSHVAATFQEFPKFTLYRMISHHCTFIVCVVKVLALKNDHVVCCFNIYGVGFHGVGGVTVTQSSCGAILNPETVAQFVKVLSMYPSFTFHVKYTVAVHQFAFSVIPVYSIYALI
jgi:hypothetical protein